MNLTLLSKILIVGAGSCLGGVSRYLVSRMMQTICPGEFPWGTFVVNVVGCLIIGLVYGLIDRGCEMNEGVKLFLTVGFCGGFTTFSTFMHENYLLFSGSHLLTVGAYAALSVFVGFLMVYAGYLLTRL